MGCAKYVDELLLLFDGEDESLLYDSREQDIRYLTGALSLSLANEGPRLKLYILNLLHAFASIHRGMTHYLCEGEVYQGIPKYTF